eukprot:7092100-Karenia_brevis.AAC.1
MRSGRKGTRTRAGWSHRVRGPEKIFDEGQVFEDSEERDKVVHRGCSLLRGAALQKEAILGATLEAIAQAGRE